MKFKYLKIETIINALRGAYNNENQSFEAFSYNEIKYVLLSHLHTSKNISRTGREQFIESFLRKFHKEEINEVNFNAFFEEAKTKYFRKKEVNYTLITSLSIDYLPFRKIKINRSILRIHGKKFPKKFLKSRKAVLADSRKEESLNDFLKVSVELKGKSFYDAFEEAYFDLNILRGILCLNINSTSEIPLTNDSHRAINKVQFGEYHTLHISESGESIDSRSHWFETNFGEKVTQFSNENKEVRKKNILFWLSKLNSCQKEHKNKLSEVFNLYAGAFDEKDKQTCFLKSWVALESLLGTHGNETIIKRCSSIYKKQDRNFQNEILKGLQLQRNQIVHENDDKINSIVNCYHIQRYIKGILLYNNLRYSKIIKNNEEALKLLDYRLQSESSLESEIKVLSAIKKIKKYES
ncbi:hypothetical protein SAMN04488009_2631 [Maribacter sedimenticola]|uniref:Apea-like HEPN domain-containing protein n=1 Tax=Maribacter sedimenticola TaxID=228956 RepID=A0ABY1SIL0_9FLAO|nr:hypothetical protein SAMN04488009_2631 [Maribacter sedimenticola]